MRIIIELESEQKDVLERIQGIITDSTSGTMDADGGSPDEQPASSEADVNVEDMGGPPAWLVKAVESSPPSDESLSDATDAIDGGGGPQE